MTRPYIICVLAMLMAGCAPCRHLTTSSRDSIRVETHIRHELQPDTVYIEIPTESHSQRVRDTTSYLETSYARSTAKINSDGTLQHWLANRPQTKAIATHREVVYRDSIIFRNRTAQEVVAVARDLSWWQRAQMYGFWLSLGLLALAWRRQIVSLVRMFV